MPPGRAERMTIPRTASSPAACCFPSAVKARSAPEVPRAPRGGRLPRAAPLAPVALLPLLARAEQMIPARPRARAAARVHRWRVCLLRIRLRQFPDRWRALPQSRLTRARRPPGPHRHRHVGRRRGDLSGGPVVLRAPRAQRDRLQPDAALHLSQQQRSVPRLPPRAPERSSQTPQDGARHPDPVGDGPDPGRAHADRDRVRHVHRVRVPPRAGHRRDRGVDRPPSCAAAGNAPAGRHDASPRRCASGKWSCSPALQPAAARQRQARAVRLQPRLRRAS